MRIRSIKPEFFKNTNLYDLEVETGLPIRIAYAGLACAADRRGRFIWDERRLKSDILPYEDVDFSRVLHALATRGFLVKYASPTGELCGYITEFLLHQKPNGKERNSILPDPKAKGCNILINNYNAARDPHVPHACPVLDNLERQEQGTRNKEQGKEEDKKEKEPTSVGLKRKKPLEQKEKSLSDGYQRIPHSTLPGEWKEWVTKNYGWDERMVGDVWVKFFEYFDRKRGASAQRSDWFATWRNWCDKENLPRKRVQEPKKHGEIPPQDLFKSVDGMPIL